MTMSPDRKQGVLPLLPLFIIGLYSPHKDLGWRLRFCWPYGPIVRLIGGTQMLLLSVCVEGKHVSIYACQVHPYRHRSNMFR